MAFVPWCERVSGSPEGGDEERDEEHAQGGVALLDQGLEATANVPGRIDDVDRRSRCRGRAGVDRRRRGRDVERRSEEIRRVLAKHVARGRRRDGRVEYPSTVAPGDRHLTPADPLRKSLVAEGELMAVTASAVHDVEPKRLQTSGTGSQSGPALDDAQPNAPAVERQAEVSGETCRISH